MSDKNGASTRKRVSGAALLSGMMLGMMMFGMITLTMTLATPAHADTIPVDISGESYGIEYTATGMTVSGADADLGLVSLILSVDVTDPQAALDVTLDRAFFDSVIDGQDYGFIVLSDGDQARFSETQPDPGTRILSISLPIGTEEVEIIGAAFGPATQPAPESGQVPEPADDPAQVPESGSESKPVMGSDPGTDESGTAMDGAATTQCGEGTILEDGVCVLDKRCGEGTILEDGVCVLAPSESAVRPASGDLAAGSIGGFAVAGLIAVGAIIILKISRRKRASAEA